MASNIQLSDGSLKGIMIGETITNPVMQILAVKKMPSPSSDKERHRLVLSDGKYSTNSAMLISPASKAVVVKVHSILKITRYITSLVTNANKPNTKVLLVLESEVLADGDEVGIILGSPESLPPLEELMKPPSSSSASVPISKPKESLASISHESHNQTITDTQIVNPISSLSPYNNKWVIKARVTNKSDIRTWSNSRGEGKLFNIDLMDETGEIRCTAFRDLVDKYYEYIQIDKVYYISKCQLKPANRQFSTLKNDYEMAMNSETIIEECKDTVSIPEVQYDFVPFNELTNKEVNEIVDVIGVCKNASELQTFTSKSTNRELKKKEVMLVDQSKTAITLTLWGNQAESFDGNNNPVVVIKGAKVGEFGGGKNISTLMSSRIKINPDTSECFRIKGWYDMEGKTADVKNLSERSGSDNFSTPWLSFKEVQLQKLGNAAKGDYYQTMATNLLIRSENAVYKACPTQDCNKKIVDLENGMYRCEKCSREYPNFKYRLLVSMNIGDYSGNQWVSLFSSEGEKVLGKDSQEVGDALENDSAAAAKIFDNANFKQFIFKCRAKMETYNDEQRLKTIVVKVDPLNFEEHNAHLISEIEKMIA